MRLLNADTYEIEEYLGDDIPPYATLSHTWTHGEEPSYQEWMTALRAAKSASVQDGTSSESNTFQSVVSQTLSEGKTLHDFFSRPSQLHDGTVDMNDVRKKLRASMTAFNKSRGTEKIVSFLDKISGLSSERTPLRHGWCDTVCIDKSSSSELSEAINSMYTIYMNCVMCLIYLADVMGTTPDASEPDKLELSQSRWFQRGWTLQELLAPRNIRFYNFKWRLIRSRLQAMGLPVGLPQQQRIDLLPLLTQITGIPEHYLRDCTQASVAQKMSWAANRVTTRAEDLAYCLLGIFGINMPLLYGEGASKAFQRLQEEVLKSSDDDSIFAWRSGGTGATYRGLLATSPKEFAHARGIRTIRSGADEPYWITNKGLQLKFYGTVDTKWPEEFLATLNCGYSTLTEFDEGPSADPHTFRERIQIRLRRLESTSAQHVRVDSHLLLRTVFDESTVKARTISKDTIRVNMHSLFRRVLDATTMNTIKTAAITRMVLVRGIPIIPPTHRSPRVRGIHWPPIFPYHRIKKFRASWKTELPNFSQIEKQGFHLDFPQIEARSPRSTKSEPPLSILKILISAPEIPKPYAQLLYLEYNNSEQPLQSYTRGLHLESGEVRVQLFRDLEENAWKDIDVGWFPRLYLFKQVLDIKLSAFVEKDELFYACTYEPMRAALSGAWKFNSARSLVPIARRAGLLETQTQTHLKRMDHQSMSESISVDREANEGS